MDNTFDLDLDESRKLVEALDEGVYVTDVQRRVVYWSPGAERITGWFASEVVGRRCQDQMLDHVDEHGQLLCGGACPLALCMMDGRNRRERMYLRHKDGRRIYIEVRTFPRLGGDGEPAGAVEVFRDLTQESHHD